MARHPSSRRAPNVDAAPDDVVIARLAQASTWARQNSRLLLIAAIVLAIAVFAAIQYVNYRGELRERAAIELLQVRQTAATGNVPAAVGQLETFVERFDGTPSAAEARLLLAQLQLSQGNAEQAVEAVRPVAERGDNLLRSAAGLLLAGALETANRPEEAEEAYLQVAERSELLFQQREALEDAARIRVDRGDVDGAVELYDRLIGYTEEGSPERDVYEMRRAEVMAGR